MKLCNQDKLGQLVDYLVILALKTCNQDASKTIIALLGQLDDYLPTF